MASQSVGRGPELFHYPRFHMALLWGCIHDRTHLVPADGVGVARAECGDGLYRCNNGHAYERAEGRWAPVSLLTEAAA